MESCRPARRRSESRSLAGLLVRGRCGSHGWNYTTLRRLRGAEAPHGRLAERRRLAGPHRGLADDGERLADLGRRVARRQDPLVEQAHLAEHVAEVRVSVLDADTGDDVLLGRQQALHDHGDVTSLVGRTVVRPVGRDEGDGSRRHPALLELRDLRSHGREDEDHLIVERRAATGVVVRPVQADGLVEQNVRLQNSSVERPHAAEHCGLLLGRLQRVDDQVVAVAGVLGVVVHRGAVIQHLGDDDDLRGVDVIDDDGTEAGVDSRSQRVDDRGHRRGRVVIDSCSGDQAGQRGCAVHFVRFLSESDRVQAARLMSGQDSIGSVELTTCMPALRNSSNALSASGP